MINLAYLISLKFYNFQAIPVLKQTTRGHQNTALENKSITITPTPFCS